MRLTLPPLEIDENEGFSDEKDIFKREQFGERLSNLIENTNGELVIALDAPWGEGKSTFIKMWRGHLKKKDNGTHTIYFDAFQNDHQSAPFLALAGEIYNLIDKRTEKSKFERQTISALKTAGRAGLRIGTKILLGSALDDVGLKAGTTKLIADATAKEADKYIADRLKAVSKDKEVIKQFKQYLENLPPKLSFNGKSIIFIIDELDRCKPPFALEIVEVVKHLFSVPNITFILVMNRSQLEASVKHEYGTDNAPQYLQKFINLWVSLPKSNDSDRCDAKTYLSYCMDRMGIERNSADEKQWAQMFEELVIYYNNISLREIERALTNFAFIRTGLEIKLDYPHMWIAVYLCIIKVTHSDEYSQLSASKIEYSELFKQTNLTNLESNWTEAGETIIETHPLKFMLRYYLSNKVKRKAMFTPESTLSSSQLKGEPIKDISKWLNSFRMN